MVDEFGKKEKIYRAVIPMGVFWNTEFGRPSSAAFKDKKGLSVDRGCYREDQAVLADMANRLRGKLCSFTVALCDEIKAEIQSHPTEDDVYHCEIHRNKDVAQLTDSQCRQLATRSKYIGELGGVNSNKYITYQS